MTLAAPVLSATQAIPEQKGLPLLGSAREMRADFVGFMERVWREHGDMVRVNIGPRRLLVLSNPALAQQVLIEQKHIFQRPNVFKGGTLLTPLLGQSVLTTDGESWLAKRRLLQPIFHRQHIQAMGDKMSAAAGAMLARWDAKSAGQALNLGEEMKLVTLDIINRTMFSVDVLPEVGNIGHTVDTSLQYLMHLSQSLIRLPESVPTPGNRRFVQARATLDKFLYRIIAERRAEGPDAAKRGDLLDMLLAARDEDTGAGMTDQQVRDEVITIYGAGHETTAVALTWTWLLLNQNPDQLAKLRAEVDAVCGGRLPAMADLPRLPYALQVFEESLRLYPPVPVSVRRANAATQLGGHPIKEGEFVGIAINNIHQHPDFWDQPGQFRPERFAPENKAALKREAYLPFFTGPHLCIGNSFALMEGQLLLAAMAQKYDVVLTPGQNVRREVKITMRPLEGLKVTLRPRQGRA